MGTLRVIFPTKSKEHKVGLVHTTLNRLFWWCVSQLFWFNVSPQGLCRIDGTCSCDDGLRGRDCSIPCAGGRQTPCHGHGDRDLAE